MSEKNLATLQALVDGLNRRAWDDGLAYTSADFELDLSRNQGDWAGVYTGRERVLELFGILADAWHAIRIELREPTVAGDAVVAPVAVNFHGRDGMVLTARSNWVCSFRDGVATRLAAYNELDDALAAAGLRRTEAERPLERDDPGGSLGEPGPELL